MSLITWKRKNGMFPNLNSMVDDFFKNDEFFPVTTNGNGSSMPSVNVKETDESFELEVAAPGKKKDDFNVEINKGVLTISSETESEVKEEKDNYTRQEFSYSSFSRSFWLPEGVEEDDVNATYNDGILKVVIPKKEVTPVPSAKKIAIN